MTEKQTPHSPPERVAAVLDVRKLVEHCAQLEQQVNHLTQRIQEQKEQIQDMELEKQRMKPVLEVGKQRMEKMKREILSTLRAIVHATGERERVARMERSLQAELETPDELQRMLSRLMQEFQSLYPTRPCSQVLGEEKFGSGSKADYSSYRMI